MQLNALFHVCVTEQINFNISLSPSQINAVLKVKLLSSL